MDTFLCWHLPFHFDVYSKSFVVFISRWVYVCLCAHDFITVWVWAVKVDQNIAVNDWSWLMSLAANGSSLHSLYIFDLTAWSEPRQGIRRGTRGTGEGTKHPKKGEKEVSIRSDDLKYINLRGRGRNLLHDKISILKSVSIR